MSTLALLLALAAAPLERPAGLSTQQVMVMVSPAPCEGKVVPHTTTLTTTVVWPARLRIRVAGKEVAQAPEKGPFEVVLRSVPNPKRRGVGKSAVTGCSPKPVTGEAEVNPGALEAVVSIGERTFFTGLGPKDPADASRWLFGAEGSPSPAGLEDSIDGVTFDGEALRKALRGKAKAVLPGTLAWSHKPAGQAPQQVKLAFTLTVNGTVPEGRLSTVPEEDDDEEAERAGMGAPAPHR
jgi:hypothetical protein